MPFGIGRKNEEASPIRVTLIDANTNSVFAITDLPPDQLPESFELSTTMHLGEEEWQVEGADPPHRAGYLAAGSLRLVLRRVERIDPNTILFSLPTLEDALPPMKELADGRSAFAMDGDDWRQREFVSERFAAEVESEMAEIRKIHAERMGVGYERVHMRSKVPHPLDGVVLTVPDVQEGLGGGVAGPLTVGGGLVIGGFALPLATGAVYGREVDGRLVVVGLTDDANPGHLYAFARQHRLLVVDWIRAVTDSPSR
jgi:hypothetical protein